MMAQCGDASSLSAVSFFFVMPTQLVRSDARLSAKYASFRLKYNTAINTKRPDRPGVWSPISNFCKERYHQMDLAKPKERKI
jgi:hypothetical protein